MADIILKDNNDDKYIIIDKYYKESIDARIYILMNIETGKLIEEKHIYQKYTGLTGNELTDYTVKQLSNILDNID